MKFINSFNILSCEVMNIKEYPLYHDTQQETTDFVFCCSYKSVLEKWLADHRRSSVFSCSLDSVQIIITVHIIHNTKTVTKYQTSELLL